jgi:hypothetical protein
MSARAGTYGVLGAAALILASAFYLWGVRGPAILLDYVWALCF